MAFASCGLPGSRASASPSPTRSSAKTADASSWAKPARGELCTSARTDCACAGAGEKAAAAPSARASATAWRWRNSCRKRIAYPLDPGRIEPVHQDDVEAAGRVLLPGEPAARGGDQPRLLAPVHAVDGAAEAVARPQP